MKKVIIILGFTLVLLTGCDKGEEISCNIDGKDAKFVLKNGVVSAYTLNGEKQSKSNIDEINGEFFTSSTNTEEGKEALSIYVQSLNGSCEI